MWKNECYCILIYCTSKARFTSLTKKNLKEKSNKGSPVSKTRVRIPNKEQVYEYDAEDLENLVDDYDPYGILQYLLFHIYYFFNCDWL